MNKNIRISARIFLAGIFATIVWYAGILFVFGPAQSVLADPAYQSSKFLEVFTQIEPLPKMYVQPVAFYIGFLIVGVAYSLAYHLIGRRLPGKPLRKGMLFGLGSWLLMNPWFEFYLPWNVMHEPIPLVLLEMVLWLIVLLLVGIVTVYSHNFLESKGI
jgi:hypothetical protein